MNTDYKEDRQSKIQIVLIKKIVKKTDGQEERKTKIQNIKKMYS